MTNASNGSTASLSVAITNDQIAVRNLFARQAVISADAYRRLLKPSIETEFASLSKSTGR